MRHFLSLFFHEVRTLLVAPSTYIAAVLFLLLLEVFYINMIVEFSREGQEILPSEMFFRTFWILVWFLVPLLTMRSIAEERRLGTLETLMTTPVTPAAVVLSKFAAAYVLYCLLWGASLAFPFLATLQVTDPLAAERLLDVPPLLGGYLFVAVSGLLFVAVGVFTSSLTRTQLVAGMLCFTILFVITVGANLLETTGISLGDGMEGPLEYLKIFRHLEDFSRGVIDSRPLFFYLSGTLLLLGVSTLMVEAKT